MPASTPPDRVLAPDSFHRATVRGCDLRYYRSGGSQAIVLLHPLRAQLDYFVPLMRHLTGSPADLVAVDLPGHGESSAPDVDYTAAYFTDAVEALLEAADVRDAILVGESIGGAIALGLAARHNPRITRVVALNPYDYGRRGGIRRSSTLANVLFTAMLWPSVGPVVARAGTRRMLRGVLAGGLYDPRNLPDDLVDELHRCGSLPGHARAFRSLCLQWQTWLSARSEYASIQVPVTLAYGNHDWSRPPEREANEHAIPGVQALTFDGCGHFSCLEKPSQIAQLIGSLPLSAEPSNSSPTSATNNSRSHE